MDASLVVITLAIVGLTAFLSFVTALKYGMSNPFARMRLIMTAFFAFIVATLTFAFWRYTFASLPYTVPAFLVGVAMGYVVGVREAERRLAAEGLSHYISHFAHIHIEDLKELRWWSLINFYTVMGALLLINFVGLSTVIFDGRESWAIATCVFGAFLIGTIVPYLVHLWSTNAASQLAK